MRFSRPLAIVGPLFAALLLATPASAFSWGPVRTLANAGNVMDGRGLAVTGSVAQAVYQDVTNVTYRRSTNGGRSWSAPVALATSTATVHDGQGIIAAWGNRVYVLYERRDPNGYRFSLRRSIDGGTTWKPAQTIATSPTASLGEAAIAAAGKRAYIAWTDHTSGGIDMRETVDGGSHWNGPFTVAVTFNTTGNGKEGYVRLAASGLRAYVGWIQTMTADYHGQGIKLRRSVDGGSNWLGQQTLTPNLLNYGGTAFSLAASGTHLVAGYVRESGIAGIARSNDGGKTLHHADLPGTQAYRWAAVGVHDAQAVFVGVTATALPEIDRRSSSDGGAHWSAVQIATKPPHGALSLSTAVGTLGTVMTWSDDSQYLAGAKVYSLFGS
jgi:hypothetical protein